MRLLLSVRAQAATADSAGCTALHVAVQHGFLQVVQELLGCGPPVDSATAQHKHTPLHLAARAGDADMVLLSRLASVDAADADGKTPAHYAAAGGHAAVVQFLLNYNADVNLEDEQEATPLSLAAQHQHAAVLQQLAKHVASKTDTAAFPHQAIAWKNSLSPLHKAAAAGQCEVVKALLVEGVPVDFPGLVTWDDDEPSTHVTPLMLAANSGQEAAAQLLLGRGAVASAQDNCGYTAVMWAAMEDPGPSTLGRIAVADMLLAAGVPIDTVSTDPTGSTGIAVCSVSW